MSCILHALFPVRFYLRDGAYDASRPRCSAWSSMHGASESISDCLRRFKPVQHPSDGSSMHPARAQCLCSLSVLSLTLTTRPCSALKSHALHTPFDRSVAARRRQWQHHACSRAMTEPLHMPMRDQLSCRAQQHASADALTSEAGALDSGRQEDSGSSSSSNGGFDCSEEHGPVMFELCKIPGDGSCLFRALAQGLHQVQTGYPFVPWAHLPLCCPDRLP